MIEQTPEARVAEISSFLSQYSGPWAFFAVELGRQIETYTADLIGTDNEQTRGRIKALMWVMELPNTLHAEREGISAGLSEQDPAD